VAQDSSPQANPRLTLPLTGVQGHQEQQRRNAMPFDPSWPPPHADLTSANFRNQFTGLKSLIDGAYSAINAIPAGPPGEKGEKGDQGDAGADGRHVVNVSDNGSGQAIIEMSDSTTYGPFTVASGLQGDQGPQGEQGPQGDPGDVSAQQLSDAIAGTANNPGDVETLDPGETDIGTVVAKLNELIGALKR